MSSQPEIEWWRTLELSSPGRAQLYFVEHTTAQAFAQFLVGDGVETVAIEHWRDGRRIDIVFVGEP
jgi:hypothetical protein